MKEFTSQFYRLSFPEDRPFVILESPEGKRLAELFFLSSIHPLEGRDETTRIGSWESVETENEVLFTLQAESSWWKKKIIQFRCTPHRLVYEVAVIGEGHLAEAHYFGGYYSGHIRWGTGFFWSGQSFLRGFTPEPNGSEKIYFAPEEDAVINLTGVPLPGKADWFFTPPPFCFAFEYPGGWLSMGVEAPPQMNRFTEFMYHGRSSAFYLTLSYEGHTPIQGAFRLPGIGFDFASDDAYKALQKHVHALNEQGFVPLVRKQEKPRWWFTPIFCGWGAQCALAAQKGGKPQDYARQEVYEDFLHRLEQHRISPGIVVIDDKWQTAYGLNKVDLQKWEDLPAFTSHQHYAGRKVLLWLKAWDPEGLPEEECIINSSGVPVAFDPTHPRFEQRLRDSVREMLSPDGYNADGFKIDFTARIPSGSGLRGYGTLWGVELMKAYLSILYSEAKKVKPDALIITHTPHPYFTDVVDMIRLNDVNTGAPVNPAMEHRARVARIACPDALIDTDNWPMPHKAAWREYLQIQPELGVPSLYFVSQIDSTGEMFDQEDYRLIREVWERWQGKVEEELQ